MRTALLPHAWVVKRLKGSVLLVFIFRSRRSLILPTMQHAWHSKSETDWTQCDNSQVCLQLNVQLKFTTIIVDISDLLTPSHKSVLPTRTMRSAKHHTMSQVCAARVQRNKSVLKSAECLTMSPVCAAKGQWSKWALPTQKIRPAENHTMSPICALRGWWRSRCFFGGIMSCSTSLWGSMISVTVWPVVLASRPSEDIACNAQATPDSKPLLRLIML